MLAVEVEVSFVSIDIAAAFAAGSVRGPRKCKLQVALDSIPDDTPDKDKLVAATNGDMSANRVAIVLSRLGLSVGATSVRTHRRGECACHGGLL